MVKRKYEYIEGRKARENFEKAMTAAFQVPKEQVPRPEPKNRTAKRFVCQVYSYQILRRIMSGRGYIAADETWPNGPLGIRMR